MTFSSNTSTRNQIENLLRITKFFDLEVKVALHSSLNTCKGVVRCPDLKGVSDQEILENMREQGVVGVRRIKVRRDETLKDTNTFVFTFNTSVLPKQLKVAFLRVSVDPYIPNPLRCYRCQVFGHHEDRCRKETICANCGQPQHCAMKQTANVKPNVSTVRKTTPPIRENARPGTLRKKFSKSNTPGTYRFQKRGKSLTATRQHQVKVMRALRRLLVSRYHY